MRATRSALVADIRKFRRRYRFIAPDHIGYGRTAGYGGGAPRNEFVYYPRMVRIPEGSAPNFKIHSWVIAAEATIPENSASGVLATIGGASAASAR
jgi:pimeloyl-ACP methyl ester carboxylesterase